MATIGGSSHLPGVFILSIHLLTPRIDVRGQFVGAGEGVCDDIAHMLYTCILATYDLHGHGEAPTGRTVAVVTSLMILTCLHNPLSSPLTWCVVRVHRGERGRWRRGVLAHRDLGRGEGHLRGHGGAQAGGTVALATTLTCQTCIFDTLV